MKVVIRQEHKWVNRALKSNTYQQPFPQATPCAYCKVEARPLMVVDDDEGLIQGQGLFITSGIWPHDCMAIALYFCPKCGEITAIWNQA